MARADLDVVLASNAALNARDVDGMLANYAPDAAVVDRRRVAFGTFTGHDELRGLYGGIVSLVSEFHEAVRVVATGPGTIVAHCEVSAKLLSDPRGPGVTDAYGYVATVRDELIARLELYDDGEIALEASGLA